MGEGWGRPLQPADKHCELVGGIPAMAHHPEGATGGALALGGRGLAGAGAGDQQQGQGAGARESSIKAVVAVDHHQQGGAAGGGEGWAQQGPEQPEGGAPH